MVLCDVCKQHVLNLTNQGSNEGLIDLHQAASLLCVSESTLYKKLQAGEFTSIRLTPLGKYLFKPSTLLAEAGGKK